MLSGLLALTFVIANEAQDVKAKPQVARATKIAFVDMEEVFKNSAEGQELIGDAQKDFQERAKELQRQEEEFKKEFIAANGAMTKELTKKQMDLQIEGKSLQEEWNQMLGNMNMVVGKKISDSIERVLKAQGWDGWVQKMFYACPDCDVTQTVIDDLNKEYKKEKNAQKFKKKDALIKPDMSKQ